MREHFDVLTFIILIRETIFLKVGRLYLRCHDRSLVFPLFARIFRSSALTERLAKAISKRILHQGLV